MTSLFLGSNPLRSNRSVLNMSNGGSWNPKLTLKVNGLWIKIKAQNFASQVLSKHTFIIWRKKGSDFFLSQGHFKGLWWCSFAEIFILIWYYNIRLICKIVKRRLRMFRKRQMLFQEEIASLAKFLLGTRTCFGKVLCFSNHLLYWTVHGTGWIVLKLLKFFLEKYQMKCDADSVNLWQKMGMCMLCTVFW